MELRPETASTLSVAAHFCIVLARVTVPVRKHRDQSKLRKKEIIRLSVLYHFDHWRTGTQTGQEPRGRS